MTDEQREPRDWLEPLLLRRALRDGAGLEPLAREALVWLRFVRWVALVSLLGGASFLAIAIKDRLPPAAPQAAPGQVPPAQSQPRPPVPRPPPRPALPPGTAP